MLLLVGWLIFGFVAFLIRYSQVKAGTLPAYPGFLEYLLPPLIIGGPLAIFDTYYLRRHLKNIPFLSSVVIRLILFSSSIVITYGLMGVIIHHYQGKDLFFYLVYFLVLWGTGSVLVLAVRNLAEHFDRRQLYLWLTGAYHQPVAEYRIFLFIDLNDSTSIAERLGNEPYFRFLSDYFALTARVIEEHHGEIYQHVGDEIIITWPWNEGRKHATSLFFNIQNAIDFRQKLFLEKYGALPSIKGSLHAGIVTKGEIIGKRREFIYTGDVLNTTSRMQTLCKPNEASLIISGELLDRLDLSPSFRSTSLGTHMLRGKEKPIEVHMLEKV